MKPRKNKRGLFWAGAAAVILQGMSLAFFKLDGNLNYRWPIFCLSLTPLLVVGGVYFLSLCPYRKFFKKMSGWWVLVLILAAAARFLLLKEYPFVSLGDEVRDGGLNAMEIATGQTKELFGYGRYEAHGLIIPTITAFFYKFFGGSALVYRLPAALAGVLDVGLLFVLLFLVTKSGPAATLGSLSLAFLPLHLFYSRTEIVVILSSFLATAINLAVFIFCRRGLKEWEDYLFLGTLLGFSFNFHAALKAFSLLVLAAILAVGLGRCFFKKMRFGQFALKLSVLLVFLIVGFGPRLLKTPSVKSFLHLSRVPTAQMSGKVFDGSAVKKLASDYRQSLAVWGTEGTRGWYRNHLPIFSKWLFGLMVLGLGVAVVKKREYLLILLGVGLVLHLTNSALTDMVNADHRLAPLFSMGSFFVGIGVAFLEGKIRQGWLKTSLLGVATGLLVYQAVIFFVKQPANEARPVADYLQTQALYLVKEEKEFFGEKEALSFWVSAANYPQFNYAHFYEQRAFFLEGRKVTIGQTSSLKEGEIRIVREGGGSADKKAVVDCREKSFYCPLDYRGEMSVYY